MLHNSAIALVVIAVLGLAGVFLSGSLAPREIGANEEVRPSGDIIIIVNTPTSQPPTATPLTPTATPPPPTDTPTPTATEDVSEYGGKLIIITFDDVSNVGVPGFEVNLHEGKGCMPGSTIASGTTNADGVVSFPNLPGGNYSAFRKPLDGWNGGEGECLNISFILFPPETGLNLGWPVPRDQVAPPDQNGDLNNDGVTDSRDALLVLQFTAGLITEVPNAERADVNQDGVVNAIDATLMLQFSAGLITAFL